MPEDDRTYYPGIFIDWNFDVQIPNQPQPYNFSLTSDPAERISYDSVSDDDNKGIEEFSEVLNADKGNIYNSMASSAFNDFKTNLVFRMGIGTAPPITDDKPSEGKSSATTKKGKK